MKTVKLSIILTLAILAFAPQHIIASAAKPAAQYPELLKPAEEAIFNQFKKAIDKGTPKVFSKQKKDLALVINKGDAIKRTLLMYATQKGNRVAIRELKANGAEPLINEMGFGPLQIAAAMNDLPTMECLFEHFKDLNDHDKQLALEIVALGKHKLSIKFLLKRRVSVTPTANRALAGLQDAEIIDLLNATLASQFSETSINKYLNEHDDTRAGFNEANAKFKDELLQNKKTTVPQKRDADTELNQRRAAVQKKLDDLKKAEKEKREAEQKAVQIAAAKKAEERLRENAIEEAARLEVARAADAAKLKADKEELDRLANERNAAESELRRQKQAIRLETQAQKEKDEELRKEQERAAAEAKKATKAALRNAPSEQPKPEKPKRSTLQVKKQQSVTREQARIKALQLAEKESHEVELRLKAARSKKEEAIKAPANKVDSAAAAQNNDALELLHIDLNTKDEDDDVLVHGNTKVSDSLESLPNESCALAAAQAAIKHKLLPRAVAFKQSIK